ncbi:ParB/RepB/Spo0J family partition protein [Rothia koreensis]|uniref:ParB/RepB/Spo0J family partition protein n=1 Tax=Rothia koreensis TaxID=592378 RepID=UPI002AA51018
MSENSTEGSGSKGRSSQKTAGSEGTSDSDGKARGTRKSTTPRADMGAALRKSAGGRRPVDFFFQPSESASADAPDSSSGLDNRREPLGSAEKSNEESTVPAGGASTDSAEDKKSGTNQSVSRETVQNATASSTTAQPEEADTGESEDATLIPVPGAHFGEIPVSDIHPNRKQPRQEFDEDEMEELVHSIREIGLLQPIVIRPSREEGDAKYELVMGERRWRATQRAGLETIPAIVRQTQDVDLLRDALLENLHRSQLNPLEEAAAYQQLLNEFGTTQDELALKIGRSRPQISNTIRLLRLPALVQRRVAAGILSAGHARALLALTDPAAMERLAQRIVAEGLSVRSVEEIIQSGAAEKGEQKPRKPATPNKHHERLDYIADAFSDKLDTNVKINLGARKGKMTIEFASVDDLNRIITVLDPKIEGE